MKEKFTKAQMVIIGWVNALAEFLRTFFYGAKEKAQSAFTESSPAWIDSLWLSGIFLVSLAQQIFYTALGICAAGLILYMISFLWVVIEASSPAALMTIGGFLVVLAAFQTYIIWRDSVVTEGEIVEADCYSI